MARRHLPPFPRTGVRRPQDFDSEEPSLEDYSDLQVLLEAAVEQRILDAPPEEAPQLAEAEQELMREPVVAERLKLLGYIKASWKKVKSGKRLAELPAAIGAFQRDAGLEVINVIDRPTWTILQQLVAFEGETKLGDEQAPSRALIRALRLRLWALGFLRRRPGPGARSEELPVEALSAFWEMCGRLGVRSLGALDPPLHEMIRLVFDHDRLIEAAAAISVVQLDDGAEQRVFKYYSRPGEQSRDINPSVENLLVCLVKTEMWLLGFDVDISPKTDFPVYGFHSPDERLFRRRKIRQALKQLWSKLGRPQDRRLWQWVTPELFQALANPELVVEGLDEEQLTSDDYSEQVEQAVGTPGKVQAAWHEGRSLGMAMWDGLRRLWRWIKRGVSRILEIGKNLVRAFFRYATKAFQIAWRAIKTVAQLLSQYIGGELTTGTDVKALLSLDGDLVIMMPDHPEAGDLVQSSDALRYFGTAFHLCCRVLALILGAIRSTMTGFVGWARCLRTLVRSYRDIRPLYEELRALPRPLGS